MGTTDGPTLSPADPISVVRRWEASHGRRLVDPSAAAWEDLDSEAVLLARRCWRVALPAGLRYWSRRRYLSFNAHGTPERLIEVQLLTSGADTLRARHDDLLAAGLVRQRYWIYALSPAPDGRVQLRTVQDPARSAWNVVTTGGHPSGREPLWTLPLTRIEAPAVLLTAA